MDIKFTNRKSIAVGIFAVGIGAFLYYFSRTNDLSDSPNAVLNSSDGKAVIGDGIDAFKGAVSPRIDPSIRKTGEKPIDPSTLGGILVTSNCELQKGTAKTLGISDTTRIQVDQILDQVLGDFAAFQSQNILVLREDDAMARLLVGPNAEGASYETGLARDLETLLSGIKYAKIREELVKAVAWRTGNYGRNAVLIEVPESSNGQYSFKLRMLPTSDVTNLAEIAKSPAISQEGQSEGSAVFYSSEPPKWLAHLFSDKSSN